VSDRHFAVLCEAIGRPDLPERYPDNEVRLARRDELAAELESVFREAPTDTWIER
ncbi:MAG: CoA transferase, partial [Actinobacteria bacterium]|nr:CoA transferase [Actinomycetota bacterium]NIS32251.1 CoA transferase [Actinomycetota bacterium]NIU67299.1 CoA transferase [Actinomycetota bacterium]NIW29084.1 CoA transferase [Actinomycetota bacterium]NIX21597.1 CoA transferase [Actinomycetota bacterium]